MRNMNKVSLILLAMTIMVVISGSGNAPRSALSDQELEKLPLSKLEELASTRDISQKADLALYYIGLFYQKRQDYTQASVWFKDVAQKFPRSLYAPLSLFQAATCLESQGKLTEALETLEELLSNFKGNEYEPRALHMKGLILLKLKRPVEAAAVFEELLKKHPQFPSIPAVRMSLAQIYLEASDSRSVEILNSIPQEDKNYPAALFTLGLAYENLKDYKNAEKTYSKLLSLSPSPDNNLLSLARNRQEKLLSSANRSMSTGPVEIKNNSSSAGERKPGQGRIE